MRIRLRALSTIAALLVLQAMYGQQWTKLGTPGSGGVYCFTNEGDTIYAGTQHWVIRSTNLGETWASADTGLPVGFLPLSLAAGGGRVYAAVTAGGSEGTIYRSTNRGSSWVRSDTGLALGAYARSVVYHQGHVYAGIIGTPGSTVGGLYVSTNNGSSWNQIPGGPDTNIISVAATGDTLYAGATTGFIYISTNLGQTWWDTLVTEFPGTEIRDILPAAPYLFVSTAGNGVYRSTDQGRTWLARNNGIGYPFHWSRPLARIGQTLFAGYDNNGAGSCGGVWKSTNNGDFWTPASTFRMTRLLGGCVIDTSFYLQYALLARNQTLFAGTFGYGIFRSTDLGLTWKQVMAPIQTYSLTLLERSGDTLYAGGQNGGHFWLSTDNGNHWDQYTHELNGATSSIVKQNGFLFAGQGFGSGVARSSDGGQTWTRSTAGPTNTVHCMGAGNGVVYAGTDAGLYKSTNNGASWTLTAYTVPANNLLVKGDVILVNRAQFGTQRTFRSTNAGASFDTVAGGLPTNFIAYDYTLLGSRIIALGSALGVGGVFSSTDDGLTWTNISGQLTFAYCSAVAGDTLYVRGSVVATTVLRRTTNFGQTWTNVSTSGLPGIVFEDLIVHNGYLFGVGHAGSVWRMPLEGTVDAKEPVGLTPTAFNLAQNYPNPFNPVTTIRYELPQRSFVQLHVHNIIGQRIATLVSEEKAAGRYEAVWNGRNELGQQLPSGVYFYRLEAGVYRETRKMLLLK